jgi:hypothetical protein
MIDLASDGFLHLMVQIAVFLSTAWFVCEKEGTFKTFTVIAILKVIVATLKKGSFRAGFNVGNCNLYEISNAFSIK